jgi:pimeloyl-ACP methyl ester carboxylesterase
VLSDERVPRNSSRDPSDAMRLTKPAHFVVLPGAGSSGLTWEKVALDLDALVLPLGDEADVASVANALIPQIEALPRPRVIVGASLGAMVAIEVARLIEVDALVLIAAGFGVHVSDAALQWVEDNPPGLMDKMARIGLADADNTPLVALRERDFASRGGQPVLLRHLQALAAYRPEPLENPPFTFVLWGPLDRSVPLEDHVELATKLGGLLVPIDGSGHAPFLERPDETLKWIKIASAIATSRSD